MGNFGTTIAQRLNPSIARVQSLMDAIMQQLRVALPAQVQSFSPGPPATVSVLITANEYVEKNTGSDSDVAITTTAMQLPLLQDVPILIPSAGGWSLTFPIQSGDECLVVFSDTALDTWMQNGGLSNYPVSQRRHSLADAVAVFGLRSKPRALSNYSTTSAQLRSDDSTVVVDLTANHVNITAPNVTVSSSGTVAVNGGTVNVTGTSHVNIAGSGSTVIEGRNFLSHVHLGVTPGGGFSGPVS